MIIYVCLNVWHLIIVKTPICTVSVASQDWWAWGLCPVPHLFIALWKILLIRGCSNSMFSLFSCCQDIRLWGKELQGERFILSHNSKYGPLSWKSYGSKRLKLLSVIRKQRKMNAHSGTPQGMARPTVSESSHHSQYNVDNIKGTPRSYLLGDPRSHKVYNYN